MPNLLPFPVRVRVIRTLVEGNSIRAVSRLTDTDKDVVMRLGVTVGKGCMRLHNALVGPAELQYIEIDEIWGFVGRHEKRKLKTDPAEYGDTYTMFAIDRDTKLIPSFLTGKRNLDTATRFMKDLRKRIEGKPHISVDGWPEWIESTRRAFGWDGADVASIVKEYAKKKACAADEDARKCGRVKSTEKTTIFGEPEQEMISTSHAERANLTTRMHQRRLTRLTNAFSRKAENLAAAVALHYFWYNFVRIHETIKTTPARKAGIAHRPWTIADMTYAALMVMGEMNPPTFQKRARRYPRLTHVDAAP